jgi:hypothetical protein
LYIIEYLLLHTDFKDGKLGGYRDPIGDRFISNTICNTFPLLRHSRESSVIFVVLGQQTELVGASTVHAAVSILADAIACGKVASAIILAIAIVVIALPAVGWNITEVASPAFSTDTMTGSNAANSTVLARSWTANGTIACYKTVSLQYK